MQYAAVHLNTPLFVILGHEGCGAVSAALEAKFEGVRHHSRIAKLVKGIVPALDGIDPKSPPAKRLRDAVKANVRWTVQQIRQTPEGRARAAEGIMKVVGAVCQIKTGRIRLI